MGDGQWGRRRGGGRGCTSYGPSAIAAFIVLFTIKSMRKMFIEGILLFLTLAIWEKREVKASFEISLEYRSTFKRSSICSARLTLNHPLSEGGQSPGFCCHQTFMTGLRCFLQWITRCPWLEKDKEDKNSRIEGGGENDSKATQSSIAFIRCNMDTSPQRTLGLTFPTSATPPNLLEEHMEDEM
jgi:hypothetical protein